MALTLKQCAPFMREKVCRDFETECALNVRKSLPLTEGVQ